ncbi:MAG: aldehyde dehydrogenase family protein [Planctomycetota bacterium]|nr:MAG: aldehyde dehydrogenase family protein [Planctomycetota bacterium]
MAHPFFINGEWLESETTRNIINPHTGEPVATVCEAEKLHLEAATLAAQDGFEKMRNLRAHERARICANIAALIAEREEDFASTIAKEAGKPIKYARGEAGRAVATFTISAEEAKRIGGEVLPLDITPVAGDRYGITRRLPVGPVFAITPFNFPLNLVAHKVGPALACGCSIVVKPASRTPLSALLLAEVAEKAGVPDGALNVLPCTREVADALVPDKRFAALTFTGSSEVGWDLKSRAGRKRVLLELGGNAGCIVDATANLDYAVERCIMGAFAYQGQVCISVQRIYAHESIRQDFIDRFLKQVKKIRIGDPLGKNTDFCAMIDKKNADRVDLWVGEAIAAGAELLCGGKLDGQLYHPTLLADAPSATKVSCREVFGPVAVIYGFKDFDVAIDSVNNSEYGLQAGVFTNDLSHAQAAFDRLEVGGVVINDVPTFRVDNMPYGGVKASGFGREGVKYTIEEMTELRLCVVNRDGMS